MYHAQGGRVAVIVMSSVPADYIRAEQWPASVIVMSGLLDDYMRPGECGRPSVIIMILSSWALTLLLWGLHVRNSRGGAYSMQGRLNTFRSGSWFNIKMSYQYRKSYCGDKVVVRLCYSLKEKCQHFDEIFITGCTESCQNDNFQCSQWWKFHQNDNISLSVLTQWEFLYWKDGNFIKSAPGSHFVKEVNWGLWPWFLMCKFQTQLGDWYLNP